MRKLALASSSKKDELKIYQEIAQITDLSQTETSADKAGILAVGFLCVGFPEKDLRHAGCVTVYQGAADLLAHYEQSLSPKVALKNDLLRDPGLSCLTPFSSSYILRLRSG